MLLPRQVMGRGIGMHISIKIVLPHNSIEKSGKKVKRVFYRFILLNVTLLFVMLLVIKSSKK